MSAAGAITVRLGPAGARVEAGALANPAALLVGRPVQDAPAILRRLYTVCPEAQGFAAALALGQGGERAPVWAEIMREHGLRIALDWPRIAGEAPDVAAARRCVAGEAGGWLAEALFAMPAGRWLATITDAAALQGWAGAGATGAARTLAAALGWRWPPFAAPLARRHQDQPLVQASAGLGWAVQALAARLVDCALLLGGRGDAGSLASGPDGTVRARVACARGVLEHRARVEGGRIAAYAIATPTEALFAPGGSAAALLAPITCRRQLDCALVALDPCHGVTITAQDREQADA